MSYEFLGVGFDFEAAAAAGEPAAIWSILLCRCMLLRILFRSEVFFRAEPRSSLLSLLSLAKGVPDGAISSVVLNSKSIDAAGAPVDRTHVERLDQVPNRVARGPLGAAPAAKRRGEPLPIAPGWQAASLGRTVG